MLQSLSLGGFRGFDEYSLSELRNINLLVGKNNCGKTSILEAIHLLESKGNPSAIRSAMYRRGEIYHEESEASRSSVHLDVCHLFRRHAESKRRHFRLESKGTSLDRWLDVRIVEPKEYMELSSISERLRERLDGNNALVLDGNPSPIVAALPLTQRDGISVDQIERMRRIQSDDDSHAVYFVTTETQSTDLLARNWEGIALTEEEELVLEALRILEPRVEKIAVLGERLYSRGASKSGVIVRMKGESSPIPLGTMGDGMWRMLTMILATIRSANGVLLVDEIDTGLHHTALSDMWRLVMRTAIRLNVQVFATTHSLDCVNSLAHVISANEFAPDSTTIQRIDKDREQSVVYSDSEIVVAANRGTEMR